MSIAATGDADVDDGACWNNITASAKDLLSHNVAKVWAHGVAPVIGVGFEPNWFGAHEQVAMKRASPWVVDACPRKLLCVSFRD